MAEFEKSVENADQHGDFLSVCGRRKYKEGKYIRGRKGGGKGR